MSARVKNAKEVSGCIFDVQPYSTHDGPGIRTLVFLKGCPLSCAWCSNPEGQSLDPQIRFFKDLCKKNCDECLRACPKNAVDREASAITIDFCLCRTCSTFECVTACPTDALQVCGCAIACSDLAENISRDSPFFGDEGGTTLSGGEPFAQPGFAACLLEQCKVRGIHTAVETCLHVPFQNIESALPFIDFFMFDIKMIDNEKHAHYCGVGNSMVLENIKRLQAIARIPLLARMPVIPGINDDQENIKQTALFLRQTGLEYVNLVPYMRLGIDKYNQLGLPYRIESVGVPKHEDLDNIISKFKDYGITCL